MIQNQKGFTVVEVLVIVVVISILIGIGALVDNSTKVTYRMARDSERQSDIIALKTLFEQYYRNNSGIYPGVAQIAAGSALDSITLNKSILTAPGATAVSLEAATSNANIGAGGITTQEYIYQPLEADGDLCNDTTSSGCTRFKLYYKKEVDSQVVVTESSRQQ